MRKIYVMRSVVVLVLFMVVISSCHRQPRVEPPRIRVAVLNFDLAFEIDDTREIKGWWFGARDIYYNPNVGEGVADAVADEIEKRCPFIEVYSRMDYKYYLASKREVLKREYPDLSNEQRADIMKQVDPMDIGRDLSVDKVVTGVVYDCHTSHHRTFHWWSSVVDVEIKLVDVQSGEVEFQKRVEDRDMFLSWLGTAEDVAEDYVKAMNKHVFYY